MRPRQYWLFKSEPTSFAWEDLQQTKGKRTLWDGVRNYQARNFLRDSIQVDDGVLFYHSSCDPNVIAGICKVVTAGYPDPSAFVTGHAYHDAASELGKPTWFAVDIEAVRAFTPPIERERLASVPALAKLELLRRGSRLSVQPVTATQWRAILALGGKEHGKEHGKERGQEQESW